MDIVGFISTLGLGSFLGVCAQQYFKSRERKFLYTEKIFDKKLQIYEILFHKTQVAYTLAHDLFRNSKISRKERTANWTPIVLDIADFLDKNSLYINEKIKYIV